jgi:type II secretory pathway component PulF
MTQTWECTAHTHSERLVTRNIQASDQKVARAKMRRKLRNKVYSVQVRLAAEQVQPMPRLDAATKALIKRKLSL